MKPSSVHLFYNLFDLRQSENILKTLKIPYFNLYMYYDLNVVVCYSQLDLVSSTSMWFCRFSD